MQGGPPPAPPAAPRGAGLSARRLSKICWESMKQNISKKRKSENSFFFKFWKFLKKYLWKLASISDQCVVTVEDVTSFKRKKKMDNKIFWTSFVNFWPLCYTLLRADDAGSAAGRWLVQGGGLACSGVRALIVRRQIHCNGAFKQSMRLRVGE